MLGVEMVYSARNILQLGMVGEEATAIAMGMVPIQGHSVPRNQQFHQGRAGPCSPLVLSRS